MKKETTKIKDTWKPYSEAGFAIEDEFVERILGHHPKARRVEGKNKDFDIVCDDTDCPATFEIKRDYKSDETGNFAIEVGCYGLPSGLSSSKAKYWVIVDRIFFWIMPTDILVAMLMAKVGKTTLVMGGDSNASEMVLIKKQDFDSPYLMRVAREEVVGRAK